MIKMNKAILISIKPRHLRNILNGKKILEIRKTMPKCDLPIDVYIYCSKEKPTAIVTDRGCVVANTLDVGGNSQYKSAYSCSGKVVAKFTLRTIEPICWRYDFVGEYKYAGTKTITEEIDFLNKSCLCDAEIDDYLKDKKGYVWHIDNLVIFDEPLLLNEHFYNVPSEATKKWFKENYIGKGVIVQSLIKAPQSWRYVEVDL